MTACTEQHLAAPSNGLAREGQKGMHKEGHSMTACTAPPCNSDGRTGMHKEGTA
jgi:hypothetical protein